MKIRLKLYFFLRGFGFVVVGLYKKLFWLKVWLYIVDGGRLIGIFFILLCLSFLGVIKGYLYKIIV